MGGNSPKPPDPAKTAAAQTATNVGSAVANQILGQTNQITPDGSLSYNQTGMTQWTDPQSGSVYDLPQFTATQTLSPTQQRLKETQDAAEQNLATIGRDQSKKLGSLLNDPFTLNGAPGVKTPQMRTMDGMGGLDRVGRGPQMRMMQGGPQMRTSIGNAGDITRTYGTDFSQDRQRVEDALMQRMNPSLSQERERLSSQLSNQGIKLGTEAYDRAMRNFGQQENDARLGAILSGGQEQSRMVGMEAARAGFENSAQAQQFGQNQTRAQFANQGNQQEFLNEQSRLGFNNDNRQTMFGNEQSRVGANNAARQQEIANEAARLGFNNQARQSNFNNQTQARGNWMNEQYASRNQPINEIAALLGTGQVTNPNFVNTPQSQMATTDYAGIVNQGFQNQMQGYNAKQQGLGSLFGTIAQGIMPW